MTNRIRLTRLATAAVATCLAPLLIFSAAGAEALSLPTAYAGPAQQVSSRGSQQFTSRNWDGYITYSSTKGTDFDSISATWIQPVVKCQTAQAWTVFWIGLDGWWDNTVEQGGSSAYCPSAGGKPEYTLWWEMYPTNSIQSVVTTAAGDKVKASVTYSSGMFTIVVKDVTSGAHLTEHEHCGAGLTCDRSSTDVITEDVGRFGAGSFFPLADYGKMSYSNTSMKDVAGHAGTISGSNWLNGAVTEASGGTTYATVSTLNAAGSGFSTTWKHS